MQTRAMIRRASCRSWIALLGLSGVACIIGTETGGEVVEEGSTGETKDPPPSETGDDSDGDHGASDGILPDCMVDADCADPELMCVGGDCVPASAPICPPAADLVCGNGIIEAPEDCDGGDQCDDQCEGFFAGFGTGTSLNILDLAARPDGRYVAIGYDGGLASNQIEITTEDGSFIGSASVDPYITEPRAVATNDSGTIVAVGISTAQRAGALAVDELGNELWALEELGANVATDVATNGTHFVVAGGNEDDTIPDSVLWFIEPDGSVIGEVSTNLGARLVSAVAFADQNEAVGAAWPDPSRHPFAGASILTRWDLLGASVWTQPIAPEGEAAEINAIVPDGAGGTWAGGATAGGPLLIHHDHNGNTIERLDCPGGRIGTIRTLALSGTGRLALGLSIDAGAPLPEVWFAALTNGVIDFGHTPEVDPMAQIPSGLAWHPDGSLIVVASASDLAQPSSWELFFMP